jgi:hypothetical protein
MPRIKVNKPCFIGGVYRNAGDEFQNEGDVPPFAENLDPEEAPVDNAASLAAANALLGGENA